MRADDGKGSWGLQTRAIGEFCLCATRTFWWGYETISSRAANRTASSSQSRFTQLGHWKPGCKYPGSAAYDMRLVEPGWFSTPVMAERVGISDVAEKEKQMSLSGLSGQLCSTIPPRNPVPPSWVIRETCFEKAGCGGANILWLLLPLQG